jgi:hypothetical protein
MQQPGRQTFAVVGVAVVLLLLGLVATSVLVGPKDWPLLLATLPLAILVPVAVARLVRRSTLFAAPAAGGVVASSNGWQVNALVMLLAAGLATAAVCLLRPQLSQLSERLLEPIFFPASRWLWQKLSWAAIVAFPVMLASLGFDLALLLAVVLLGLVVCSSVPALGALLGWLFVALLRRLFATRAGSAPQSPS